MRIYTKKLLSFLLTLVIIVSSLGVIMPVFASGPDVRFELNGGTLQGSSSGFGTGDILPNYEKVTKAGSTFGGWYADADFTGNQVFTVPADLAESTTYYARWIKHDVNFETFDSYTTDEELASHWEDWKYPATGSVTSLNTDSNHAYSGNSIKVCPNEANKATQLAVLGDFPKNGAGIAFWIESTSGAAVYIKFNENTQLVSQVRNVPAGKQIVTIPWSDINGALDTAYLWQTVFFVSVPNADDAVFIDGIGVYTDCEEGSISFDTNGGIWTYGYNPPEQYKTGMALPAMDNIKRDDLTFGGWYDNADFTGNPNYTVPDTAVGDITYYARWIKHDVNFETFDSYTTDEELASHWEDWKYPATGSVTSLNTDSNHAYSGNSIKVCPNEANKATQLAVLGDFPKNGAGIAFWIESTSGAAVYIKFNENTQLVSQVRNVPAGKQIVTIPWSDINGALDTAYLWQTVFFVSVPNADDAVFIDGIGVYTDCEEGSISFDTNGGIWTYGYNPPEQYKTGMALPSMDNIEKDGLAFAGWYDNAGFTGKPNYSVADTAVGDIIYYARWIKLDVNFSGFEKYTDNSVVTSVDAEGNGETANDKSNGFITEETGADGFYYWSGVAGSTVQLNTNPAYANSGSKSAKLVLKVKDSSTRYNTTHFGSDRVFFPNDKDLGEGICFWINTDKEIQLAVQLNSNTESSKVTVSAGKHFVTIPWADLENKKSPWFTIIRFDNPGEETTVYIDDIGTYTVPFDNKVTFNMNGGECVDGYIAPNGYNFSGGLILPDCSQIKRDGLTFAGWYDNADLKGSPVYSIAPGTSGDKEYWAKWIIHDVNFENFDSYDTDEDMLNDNHWSDWKYPATGSLASLNADSNHAYSGNSMKICPNAADKASQLAITRVNYPQIGDGIAFWMESANGATVYLKFNNNTQLVSQVINVPAGKHIVTIPWSEISGALTTAYLWQTSLFISVPNAEDAVYIDEIGTYKEDVSIANTVTYYTLGGNWAGGYTAPTKYTAAGDKLPAYGSIVKQDYLFAGWYDNKDYSGEPVTVTPESGDIKLYAKWINAAAEFENFESYTDDNTDWEAWTSSTTPTLNTEIKNVCSGTKSLKLGVAAKETYNDNYAVICKQATFNKAGDGVSFWIKSEIATVVQFAFNSRTKDGYFVNVNVPAGKSFVTIPWTEFTALADVDSFWCVIISIATGSRITNTVYIDDIGTYAAIECDKAMANWENGFSYFLDDDGKTVWNYSKTTGSEESSYIGFATDYMLEKDKKYVIAFDYKYLKEGRLSWSLEPQAVGNAFDESLIKQQTDENRQTLNDKNLNSDWSIMKIAFAATSVTDENKYLAFFGKTNPNAEYDISMKNIRLYTLGDVDFSGGIDTLDLTVLKKYLLGADSTAEFTDVNDDINTDIRDLIALKKILAK